jgi:hypothetical protein
MKMRKMIGERKKRVTEDGQATAYKVVAGGEANSWGCT